MGPFIRRTHEQLEQIPASADFAVAALSAWLAAASVAPFILSVDQAVVAYTSSRQSGGASGASSSTSLSRTILHTAYQLASSPRRALQNPALWMVAGVYGLTYTAANLSDAVAERAAAASERKKTTTSTSSPSPSRAAAGKFVATTAVNMAGSVMKDAAFARMFSQVATAGGPAAAAAVLTVPAKSYVLFAARDCFTIGGAFFVPDALAATLEATNLASSPGQAATAAQLLAPPLMQFVCTPLHVLALQFVQVPEAGVAQRFAALASAVPAVFVARALRMLPAYGVGGIVNSALQTRGRQAVADAYCPDLPAPIDRPQDYQATPATYLYGSGLHPVMLAREWALLINGMDVEKFIAENDVDGDGMLDVDEIEAMLARRGLYEGAEDLVRVADLNGDGKIDADELRALLTRRGTQVSYRRRPSTAYADPEETPVFRRRNSTAYSDGGGGEGSKQ